MGRYTDGLARRSPGSLSLSPRGDALAIALIRRQSRYQQFLSSVSAAARDPKGAVKVKLIDDNNETVERGRQFVK